MDATTTPASLRLSAADLMSLGIASSFTRPTRDSAEQSRCNGLAFSDIGDMLVSSHNDGVLMLHDGRTAEADGKSIRRAEFHVYETGCRNVTFTHNEACVLHAASKKSSELSGQIAYHTLHENKIVRYFRAHTDVVNCIAMHPMNDTFATVSRDGTFKMWDLRMPNCTGSCELGAKGYGILCFDTPGTVLAVATPARALALYDGRKLTAGAFTFTPTPLLEYTVRPYMVPGRPEYRPPPPFPPQVAWTGMEFSPDSRYLALATLDRGILIVDAFYPARELALLNAHPADTSNPANISFSPDGKFLVTGAVDGHVYAYDLSDGPKDVPLGATQENLPPLPYEPKRWEPPFMIVGEAHKRPEIRDAQRTAAVSHMPAVYTRMHEMMAAQVPPSVPSVPFASALTPEEAVSRQATPVRVVKWHPTRCVLASGAADVVTWTLPPPV